MAILSNGYFAVSQKRILASYIVAWAKAVGEFGATIMVAGAMPLKTETLTTSIFLRLSSADIDGAVIFIILLLSIGFLALSLFRFIAKIYPMIELQNIQYKSTKGETLLELDHQFELNQFHVILGPSGAGKTILLELLAGTRST